MDTPPALDEPPALDDDSNLLTSTSGTQEEAAKARTAEVEKRIEREASKAAAEAARLASSFPGMPSSSSSPGPSSLSKENEENFMDEILRVGTAARRAKEEKKRAECVIVEENFSHSKPLTTTFLSSLSFQAP